MSCRIGGREGHICGLVSPRGTGGHVCGRCDWNVCLRGDHLDALVDSESIAPLRGSARLRKWKTKPSSKDYECERNHHMEGPPDLAIFGGCGNRGCIRVGSVR